MHGYVYIIHEREFAEKDANIYKFGRTFDIFTRFKQYPKKSILLLSLHSTNPISHERIILDALRRTFLNRRDIGSEYFQGSLSKMICIVSQMIVFLNPLHCIDMKTVYKSVCTQTSDTDVIDVIDVIDSPFEKYRFCPCKSSLP
jgi:hypothetical protein